MVDKQHNVVLSFYNTVIRKSDIDILRGPHWLSDTIISFYFEYLENKKYKDSPEFLFVSPQVTQCIKVSPVSEIGLFLEPLELPKRKFAFFALNDHESAESSGGSHWSLLFLPLKECVFYHIDSCRGSNHRQAKKICSKLTKFFKFNKEEMLEPSVLQQSNSYDCGVHVVCNADALADKLLTSSKIENFDFLTKILIREKRNQIVELIDDLRKHSNT